jgi:hypothetical protein
MDMKAAQAARANLGSAMRDYLTADLEALAERHPSGGVNVEQLLKDNREFSAIANIQDAVESRLWKEQGGNTSGKGHIAQAVGSMVGTAVGGAVPFPGSHVVGALAGGAVGGATQAAAAGAKQSATKALANVHGKLADLALRASRGDQAAANLLHKIHSAPAIMSRLAGMHANSLTEQVGNSGGQ